MFESLLESLLGASLSTFIVVFREAFEIALILGIVLAATRGIAGRAHWVMSGIVAGVIGAGTIAYFASSITASADGMGQELMNAGIMLAAAAMISWTVIWMKAHAGEMSQKVKQVGQKIREGEVQLYSLALIVALAIFREGAEIVLFSHGLLASGMGIAAFAKGAVFGLLAGAVVGLMIYYGLIKIFTRHFFTITSWMLALLAAGMAAQAASFLIAAGYISEMGRPLWNSSDYLSESTLLSETLKVLVGYSANPYPVQLLFYFGTLGVIGLMLLYASRQKKPVKPVAA